MAKTKNKKNLADAAAKKKVQQSKKSINPFEVHINKDKQKVLGRKSKADRGLPGVARSKAISKRKHTLLHEFTQKDKDNFFNDARIGERNSAMTREEKSLARFAAEKMKAHKKQSIFNLNDDEILTHKGQTLEEIEKFEDPVSDDDYSDDEYNKKGHLDKQFVDEAHFGGGILTKSDTPLSRKELIEQLIVESKKRKAEKQKIREQTIGLTEKLDSEWKDLLPIIANSKKTLDEPVEQSKIDDYDKAVKELKFESRGNPSDRLKSEEEIMKSEKEKLEALEQDRLARMKGFVSDADARTKFKSADDLDDGFEIEEIDEEALAYGPDGHLITNKLTDAKGDDSENEDVASSNHDSDDSDKESERHNGVDDSDEDTNAPEGENNLEVDDSDEDNDEDDLSDLKASESSSDGEDEPENENPNSGPVIQTTDSSEFKTPLPKEEANGDKSNDRLKEIREDLQRRKEIMEKAREELPYTYTAPENFEEFKKLLQNQSPDYQSIILERIIKCNHWSLGQGNRDKLCKVFEYLLHYLIDCARVTNVKDVEKCFQICDRLCPHLFDLAQASPSNTFTCMQTLLREKCDEFKKRQKKYPELDTLVFFKLVSLIFPTSDFRHPIVTPCLVLMSQILFRCRVKTKTDISKGLFIVTLILEYTLLSKRFSPSAINFLRGIIYLATVKPSILPKVVPPFKRAGEFSNLLILEDDHKDLKIEVVDAHMQANDLCPSDINDDFKIRVVITAINLINEFKDQLKELDAVYTIFEPIVELMKLKSWTKYPKNIRQHINKVCEDLQVLKEKKLNHLVREKKKPKALRLYEPKIEQIFDGKRHKPMSREKAEREKLLHKLKKERKGAIREIRRDTAFLSKVQIKQQIKNDEERKRKVKEIFGEGAMQQGELNKLKRKK